jgi:hypothetical protein
MWANEALVVLSVLACGLFCHYLIRLWSAPADAVLGAILGASFSLCATGLYFTRHIWGVMIGTRASLFIMLYLWCVLGMVFFAAPGTHRLKLVAGLSAQAGIVYSLFLFL